MALGRQQVTKTLGRPILDGLGLPASESRVEAICHFCANGPRLGNPVCDGTAEQIGDAVTVQGAEGFIGCQGCNLTRFYKL